MSSAIAHRRKRGRPPTGEAQSAAERMRRYRAAKRAAGFRAVTRYEPPPRSRLTASELDRRIIEARDLALHCLAAKKIDQNRMLLIKAARRLDYWRRVSKDSVPLASVDEWTEVMSKPWGAIAVFITNAAPEAARLRRLSPFDVVLTPRERKRIYAAFSP